MTTEKTATEPKPTAVTTAPTVTPTTGAKEQYRIRLVAVKDTKNIDTMELAKIGTLQKERSGAVFVISVGNFSDLPSSTKALQQCKSLGYKEAYIMQQVNGKFVKL